MNAAAFRSHLMQQFVSAARNQARTPIALIGWVPEGTDQERSWSSSTRQQPQQQPLSSIAITSASSHTSPLSPDGAYPGGRDRVKKSTMSTRAPSAAPAQHDPDDSQVDNDEHEPDTAATSIQEESPPSSTFSPCYDLNATTASFQTLLRTRRTTSKFRTTALADNNSKTPPELLLTPEQYRAALHRAVLAGRAAPNHKRTEPFSFRRLIAPSSSTERLADIAQQVYLRSRASTTAEDPAWLVAAAQRKRDKWSQIPAFLVTLVSTRTKSEEGHNEHDPFATSISRTGTGTTPSTATTANEHSIYDPLPYQPPASERALEDYAAACAATQNVLLSLHSEGLASKWATGPVIRTPAFRDLIQASPDDRVVALVMIGQAPVEAITPTTSHHHRARRYRRSLEGDVLQDL